MASILKYEEWQGATGRWYCNNTSHIAGIAGQWWVPARLLNISLTDYVLLLKNEYHAVIVSFNPENNFLSFHWEKKDYSYMHKFVLMINRESRKRNFKV